MKVSDYYPIKGDFAELLSDAQMSASTDWEVQFTEDMVKRFDEYGMDMFISQSQLENLERIVAQ